MIAQPLFDKLIKPRSTDEDARRREFILNLLLLGSLILSIGGVGSVLVDISRLGQGYRGEQLLVPMTVFAFFGGLYLLSRIRFHVVAAYLFIGVYYLIGTYILYKWGILLVQGVLLYVLAIVMSGVLIGSRFASVMTGLVAASLITLSLLEIHGIITPDYYWVKEPGGLDDAIVFSLTLVVMAIVSWLSNREIERSLERARRSEKALTQERDLLEEKVMERTKELQQAQLERVAQIYRFAEFGRLASGVFHDLVNPLTTVSLNLEQLSSKDRSHLLQRAIDGTKRMENFIEVARKQVQRRELRTKFCLNNEVGQAISLLDHKARANQVTLNFKTENEVEYTGNPLKFHQILVNLVSNGIDAYRPTKSKTKQRAVTINLLEKNKEIILAVSDQGTGIKSEFIARIFDPFFTTKNINQGTGIGLSITKDIVEKDLGGHIEVESTLGKGTTFTVRIPQK